MPELIFSEFKILMICAMHFLDGLLVALLPNLNSHKIKNTWEMSVTQSHVIDFQPFFPHKSDFIFTLLQKLLIFFSSERKC